MSTLSTANALTEFYGDPIHVYTRADAIRDGALIDVTTTAREAGFVIPVAMTAEVWADAVAWTEADAARKPEGTGQDEAGRLWDVLYMAWFGIQRAKAAARVRDDRPGNRATFTVLRVPATGRGVRPRPGHYEVVIGPGDTPEPVATIQQHGQD